MRWSTTVAGWNRRKNVSASLFVAFALVAALAGSLRAPWLATVGLWVAAAGGLIALLVTVAIARAEIKKEDVIPQACRHAGDNRCVGRVLPVRRPL